MGQIEREQRFQLAGKLTKLHRRLRGASLSPAASRNFVVSAAKCPEAVNLATEFYGQHFGCILSEPSVLTQDFHSLATYLSQCTSTAFLDIVSDFHLLLFLVTNEVMPLRDSIGLLLDAVRTSNEDLAQTWKKSEQWATIEQLCSTVGGQPSSSQGYGAMGGPSLPASSSAMWSCLHCTFMNQPGTEHCEMCSLPRS